MTTYKPLPLLGFEQTALPPLTLSLEDHLAKAYRTLANASEWQTTDSSGLNSLASVASYDPAGLWRRILPPFLRQTKGKPSPRYWGPWSRWAMMRRGEYGVLAMWVRPTNESGSSLWPTYLASDATHGGPSRVRGVKPTITALAYQWRTPTSTDSPARKAISPKGSAIRLGQQVFAKGELLWRTPQNADWKSSRIPGSTQINLTHQVKLKKEEYLNPGWVSTLMGFPANWLDIDGPQDPEPISTLENHQES